MKPLVQLSAVLIAMFAMTQADSNSARAAELKRAHLAKLDNGLEVVVIPDHRAPIVTHVMTYRVGAADETPGISGLAHFLEHLMYKSTANLPNDGFARTISRLGGRENATTTHDATIYHVRVPKENLASVMKLEADRMRGLQFDAEEIQRERDVIIEERRQRIELSPINLLNEQITAALHPNHPYRIPVLGWAHEMSRLTREHAMAFYARHYAPNNAVLVIQGDVEAKDAVLLARAAYGGIPRGTTSERRARPSDPEGRAARRVELIDSRVPKASIFRSYFAAIAPGDDPAGNREALEILIRVLAQGDTSRLHKRLVETENLAILAEGGTSIARDGVRLALYAVATNSEKLDRIELAIEQEVRSVAEAGISVDELDRARAVIEAADVFDGDNQLTHALRYAEAIANDRSIEDIAARSKRLAAVTTEQVRQAAQTYLRREQSVTGILLPVEAATTQPRQAGALQ